MTRLQGLYQGLQHLLSFKGGLPQAIRRSSIIARSYLLVEGPVNGLCYRHPNLSQLEGWQLWLDISYHQLAHKNDILQASQGYNWCTSSSRSNHWYDCAVLRSFEVNCDELRLAIHIKVLFLAVLLSRNQKKLSTAFYLQTDGQTKRQNSTMKAYLEAFVNWERDDWARRLLMAEFAYNITKNTNTGHTSFELHCGYHPRVFFKENVDFYSRSHSANKLAEELRELMKVCCQNLLYA